MKCTQPRLQFELWWPCLVPTAITMVTLRDHYGYYNATFFFKNKRRPCWKPIFCQEHFSTWQEGEKYIVKESMNTFRLQFPHHLVSTRFVSMSHPNWLPDSTDCFQILPVFFNIFQNYVFHPPKSLMWRHLTRSLHYLIYIYIYIYICMCVCVCVCVCVWCVYFCVSICVFYSIFYQTYHMTWLQLCLIFVSCPETSQWVIVVSFRAHVLVVRVDFNKELDFRWKISNQSTILPN